MASPHSTEADHKLSMMEQEETLYAATLDRRSELATKLKEMREEFPIKMTARMKDCMDSSALKLDRNMKLQQNMLNAEAKKENRQYRTQWSNSNKSDLLFQPLTFEVPDLAGREPDGSVKQLQVCFHMEPRDVGAEKRRQTIAQNIRSLRDQLRKNAKDKL